MMRLVVVSAVAFLVGGCLAPAPLTAQAREIRAANLPEEYEDRLLRMYESRAGSTFVGSVLVDGGEEVSGDVAATEGPLRIDGRIAGSVAMIRGEVVVGPEGIVSGDLIVVDGELRLEEGATVGGEIVEFSSPNRDRRIARDRSGRPEARADGPEVEGREGRRHGPDGARRVRRSDGTATMTLRTGPSYNRVEGLALMFGPMIRTRGNHPLRVEALGIWRTAAEPSLGAEEWGYDFRATQFLDRDETFRLGGSAFSVVDPINRWQLRDTEASLATLGFHQDFRDHFGRDGWSVFAGLRPVPELDLQIEYQDATHSSVAAADPWTLFNDHHPWRVQPLVGEGELRSVTGSVELDFRDDRDDPFSGWYARAEVRRGVGGDLVLPELLAVVPEGAPGGTGVPLAGDVPAMDLSTDFTTAFVDLRRYAPVTDGSQLNFRIVGGGNVEEAPLPPQFQHALGGPGSLPGFSPFSADCGARSGVGSRNGVTFFPGFGCDRFVLGQVEFRGRFSLDLGFGEPDRGERERGKREWWEQEIDLSPRWMVFFDAGQGWAYDEGTAGGRVTTGRLYDAGAGFLIDDVGIYFAVPLNGGVERDTRFFVRLQRRF
ncbi:MAG: polymer-forming cytoskeletal protein [Longimicrobiales bacterium]|nr:polymer-forming cytoskeletal protein [Longimicrobiales bacterium]